MIIRRIVEIDLHGTPKATKQTKRVCERGSRWHHIMGKGSKHRHVPKLREHLRTRVAPSSV